MKTSSVISSDDKINPIVYKVCVVAALAGLLFGLDLAYVNGSLHLIAKDFHISSVHEQGMVAGLLLFGAAIGALFSGGLSRAFGRKKLIIISALIFTVFTFAGVFAPTFKLLLASRFIVGLAVGVVNHAV